MRILRTIKPLLAALLMAAAPSGTYAASFLVDGDFDNLPVGTAPDRNTPAGGWFWPAKYLRTSDGKSFTETSVSQVSIVPAPGDGGGDNAMHYAFAATDPGPGTVLPNLLTQRITKASGEMLSVSFDIYVAPGRGGADIVLSNGSLLQSQFGPYLRWRDNGKLYFLKSEGFLALFDYPRGVWQSVRLKIDLAQGRFDLEWSERGQPVTLIRTGMTFAGAPPYVDRLEVARGEGEDVNAFLDNFRVTTGPLILPVKADLVVGGTTTLQVANLKPDSTVQWRHNGADLTGSTGPTLDLSKVTADHAGSYTAVVITDGQSVTTEPSAVRVFDQLTLTTPPQSLEAPSGKATGFSVAAIGPLPMTYQWRRNGVDLPGKTTRLLTFNAAEATAGDYSVVVSDANGSIVSPTATLAVLAKPGFARAPLAQSVVAGGSVTFSALITGNPAPFTYQWRKGSTYANSTVLLESQSTGKTAFLTLNNVQPADAGIYRLYLANAVAPDLTSASPNRSFNLTVLPDTDGDGLPDEWEAAHGLNSADGLDARLDHDGDGQSNLAEYQSGTVPTSAASALRVETVTQANGQATVSFTAAANQTYSVEWKAGAVGGSWHKLVDIVAQADDHLETVTDAAAADGARFYRVITPRQP